MTYGRHKGWREGFHALAVPAMGARGGGGGRAKMDCLC